MFENLIESKRKSEVKKGLSTGFFSLIMHGAIVAGALYGTLKATKGDDSEAIDTMMVYVNPEEQQKQEEPEPVVLDVPLRGFQTIAAPTDIPTDIPPIDLKETFDPKDYSGVGVEGGLSTGAVPSADQVYLESVVEERPDHLSGPPPQYPEILKTAGVEGRVTVRAVIDTTGRAIPSTVKVVQSAHSGFDQSAKNFILQSLFRPGRVGGRAVKVLIDLPIDFKLTNRR